MSMKLPKKDTERQYELTFLVPGDMTEAEVAKAQEAVEALIKKQTGKVIEKHSWGKKLLEYKIKKNTKTYTKAVYAHWLVEFKAEKISTFEKDLLLQLTVIRHLLVIASDEALPAEENDKGSEEQRKD